MLFRLSADIYLEEKKKKVEPYGDERWVSENLEV